MNRTCEGCDAFISGPTPRDIMAEQGCVSGDFCTWCMRYCWNARDWMADPDDTDALIEQLDGDAVLKGYREGCAVTYDVL